VGAKPTRQQVEWQREARERLLLVLEQSFHGHQTRLAAALGVTPALVSTIVRSVQPPTRNLMTRLGTVEGVNPNWAMTGEGEPWGADTRGTLPVATALLPGSPLRYPHLLSGQRHPVARDFERATRYWLSLTESSPLLCTPALNMLPGDLLLLETCDEWTRRPDLTDGRTCGVQFATEFGTHYRLGVVTSSARGPSVRLFGGTFVPPPPLAPKQRRLREGVRRRRTVRFLDREEAKARARDQKESAAKQAAALGLPIMQSDVVAVQVYMARPVVGLGLDGR